MVHVEKIKVKGNIYYKLVHSIRKDGKVKSKSRYLGKHLPAAEELDKLKKEFYAEILQGRQSASSGIKENVLVQPTEAPSAEIPEKAIPFPSVPAEPKVHKQKELQQQHAQKLDEKYLTPLQSAFHIPEGKSSPLSIPKKFREIVKNLHEVVYVADPNTFLVTYVSPSIKELFGYSPVEWEADSSLLERLIHPEDRENVIKNLNKSLESKTPFQMEYRVNTRKGKTVWVKHQLVWEKGNNDYITALLGIFEDVSLQKNEKERTQLMYDDSPVAMMEMDFSTLHLYLETFNLNTQKQVWEHLTERPNELQEVREMMQITSVNKSLLRLFKAKNKEAFLKIFYMKAFMRDSNEVFIKELMAIAQDQNEFESKVNIFSMDGRRIQVVLKWKVPDIYLGNYRKVLVSYIDSSFQREMGRVMNVKNYAIESSPGAIAITDLEGRITYVNPAFLKMWSIKRLEDVTGTLLTRYFPNEKNALKILHKIHLKEQWRGEIIIGKGKQQTYLRSNGIIVRDSFDEPIALVFSFIDITEVRKSEQIRLEFTNIAAHELKTPLVPLKTLLTMVYEDPKQFGINKQGMEHLTVCMRNVNRLNILIGDILDISRLEAGGMKFKQVKYNVSDVVKEVVNNFKETVEKKGIYLRAQLPKKLPDIYGDGQKISQVLGNLVKNATHYTEQGTIFIKVVLKEKEIQVDVIDTGIGIPPSAQEKLFTKFYQVQDITTRSSKGSGLGLAISKGIIEHHGGKIWAFSEGKNKGSTFSFTLPITTHLHKEAARKEEKELLMGDKLLLDENQNDIPPKKMVAEKSEEEKVKQVPPTPSSSAGKPVKVIKPMKKDRSEKLLTKTEATQKQEPSEKLGTPTKKKVVTGKERKSGGGRIDDDYLLYMVEQANLKERFSPVRINYGSLLPIMRWNDSITLGYNHLRHYYKNYLSAINQLIIAFNHNEAEKIVPQVLNLLQEYVTYGLPAEEKDMEHHQYPRMQKHKKAHAQFVTTYKALSKKIVLHNSSKIELTKEVLSFLVTWWIDHIEREDHNYCTYVQGLPDAEKEQGV